MKTVLYMGITINGQIARGDGTVDWNSKEGWKSFYNHGKNAGNFIMGANTYLVGVKDGTFPFEGALNIVMTQQNVGQRYGPGVVFTNKLPKDVLKEVEERGFQTALLIGGGKLNTSFIKENLIDEVYLDIEPVAFGGGLPLFADGEFQMNLELLETKKLGPNTIQLHYQVLK